MKEKKYDVVGIGSPLVDLTVNVEDAILEDIGLKKGQMHLILEETKSADILSKVKDYKMDRTPGGSSANTLAGIAMLGGKGALFGTVGNDSNAEFYIAETEKAGTRCILARHSSITGHAITFITPDSERTFATHLGAAIKFRKKDVAAEEIQAGKILHIEGYLLELPEIREAVLFAMETAKESGVKISIDLADPALISRIPDVILSIVKNYADIVFVNELEAKAFTGKEEEEALEIISSMCDIAVVKLGSKGSLIKKSTEKYRVSPNKIEVVNTNGAGDLYAAGLLYGISKDLPLERAGRIASYVSSLVVAQVSTRLSRKIDINSIA